MKYSSAIINAAALMASLVHASDWIEGPKLIDPESKDVVASLSFKAEGESFKTWEDFEKVGKAVIR